MSKVGLVARYLIYDDCYCPTRQFMMDAPSTNMQSKRSHDDGADFLASCVSRLHKPPPKLSRKRRIADQALRNAYQLT
jgi:hypothetical protein